MLFDTHTHLNFPDFDVDREEILRKAQAEKLWLTNVGTDFASSKSAVELASKFDQGVYATIGLHPTDSPNETFDENSFTTLLSSNRVVAIGECGLDYYHEKGEAGREPMIDQIAHMQHPRMHPAQTNINNVGQITKRPIAERKRRPEKMRQRARALDERTLRY